MAKRIRIGTALGTVIGVALSQQAFAAGFALSEQSAIGIGASLAGAAAGYDDASAVWYNPAAMSRLEKRTVSVGMAVINVEGDFDDRGSSTNPLLGDNDIAGSTSGFSTTELVPSFFYVAPLSADLHYGLAITPTYGLATHYDDDWTGRYSEIDSELSGVSIVPSLAFAWRESLSVGAGLNVQYLQASLSNAIDTGAICLGTAGTNAERADCLSGGYLPANAGTDSSIEVEGESWAVGFNAGLLYEVSEAVRVGAAYHSEVKHSLEGDADFTQSPELQALLGANSAGLFSDTGASADATTPASLALSAVAEVRPGVSVMAEIQQTWWSSFDSLTVSFDNPAQEDSVSVYDWDDTRRYSVGLAYQANARWQWRAGLALDESPVPNAVRRTPRIPDTDRTWFSLGASYLPSPSLRLDAALAIVTSNQAAVDHTEENSGHTVRGVFDVSSTVLGAQLSWTFD